MLMHCAVKAKVRRFIFSSTAAVYGNPLNDQIKERGGVEPEHVVEALVKAFEREFGSSPAKMPLQAIVFSGRKAS